QLLCRVFSTASIGLLFFFFNDTATTYIYTLSLHDALPISDRAIKLQGASTGRGLGVAEHHADLFANLVDEDDSGLALGDRPGERSEEHTSELQSRGHLVCRLLLEKKKKMASATEEGYNRSE